MRIRFASVGGAVLSLGIASAGCGDPAECTGAEMSGGPVTCEMAGTFDRTVCVDGKVRHFREYVPEAITCDAPPPLIVFLHGNGGYEGSGAATQPFADELGAVYVTLRGYDQGGYLGFGPEGIDNSRRFLTMVVDAVRKEQRADSQLAVLTGFSAGGFFASYCIAWLNDRLGGVGIFGGGLAETLTTELAAAPVKLPVLVRAGESDPFRTNADSLATQLAAAGWPSERLDYQLFVGGHSWEPEMIRDTFLFAKSLSQF